VKVEVWSLGEGGGGGGGGGGDGGGANLAAVVTHILLACSGSVAGNVRK